MKKQKNTVDARPFDCRINEMRISGTVTLTPNTDSPHYSVWVEIGKDTQYTFTIAQVGLGASKTFETRYLTRVGSRRLFSTSAFHYTDKKIEVLFEKALTILLSITFPSAVMPSLSEPNSHHTLH